VITGISINFANKSGLLSSCTQSQLYDISRNNGVEQSYYEWSGSGVSATKSSGSNVATIGSVLCIDPSIDLH
jgi:pantoate kinase